MYPPPEIAGCESWEEFMLYDYAKFPHCWDAYSFGMLIKLLIENYSQIREKSILDTLSKLASYCCLGAEKCVSRPTFSFINSFLKSIRLYNNI